MSSFLRRLVQREAPFLVRALRGLADAVAELIPGPPVVAFPVLFHLKGAIAMSQIVVADTEADLSASVAFVDAEGSPTTADDIPQWSSTDENVAVVTAADDGMSATFAIGSPGAAVIEVSSTNTDGSTVVSQGTITVQPGDAVIGDITFSTPSAMPVEPTDGAPADVPVDEAPVDEEPV